MSVRTNLDECYINRKYAQLELSDDDEQPAAEQHPAPTTAGVQKKQKQTRRKVEPVVEEPEAAINLSRRKKRGWEENSGEK